MLRKTLAEIDLNAIKHNLKAFKSHVGDNVNIMLPVKADAYGHGITEVSRFAEENNLVDMFGTASLDEGVMLRENGIKLPILVLGLILPYKEQVEILFEYGLSQTIADTKLVSEIARTALKKKKEIRLHLKVDTGMGRIGCTGNDALIVANEVNNKDYLFLEGIFSHFPVADEKDNSFTPKQIRRFKEIIARIEEMGIKIPVKHIANSAGIINFRESFFNMVRPGIMAYGYSPSPGMKSPINVIPAMSLKSVIIFIKKISRGTPLSYGLTYTADSDSYIATIPVGYGDGFSRALSNKGKVIISGKTYPIVGRITMDQLLVNLGNDYYPPGEEVVMFGKETITANDIASMLDTIPYEVTCNISKRVPRIYIK